MEQAATHEASMPAPRKGNWVERLRRALEPGLVGGLLDQAWGDGAGVRVKSCDARRVHPRKPGTFLIEYEAVLRDAQGERRETLLGELVDEPAAVYRATVLQSLAKRRRAQLSKNDPGRRVVALADPGLLIRPQGLDERLPGLKLVHDAEARSRLLHAHGLARSGEPVHVELLGHRLGRRCIARLRAEESGGSAIVKLYKARSARPERVAGTMQALWSGGLDASRSIRIPRLIECRDEHKLLLMEDVPGRPMACTPARNAPVVLGAAGRGLARMRSTAVPLTEHHRAADEMGIVDTWVHLLGSMLPAWQERLRAVRDTVAGRLARAPRVEPAPVHRDFYDKQILVAGSRTVLIDFDTMALSDPALDVANFIAHLRLGEHGIDVPVEILEEAFLDGYGPRPGDGFAARLHAYLGSSLLRLACIHGVTPHGRERALGLLEAL